MGLGELSPWHLLILAAVVLVLFGAKKLPDSARSLGRAMRIFKAETSGLRGDGDKGDDAHAQQQQQPAAAAPVQQIAAPAAPATPPPPEPQSVSIRMDDGTIVTGAPLPETQRTSQTS